jgi:hypothetical protein
MDVVVDVAAIAAIFLVVWLVLRKLFPKNTP